MRKIKITKMVIKKGAIFMGFTISQIIFSVIGIAVAILTLYVLLFVANLDTNLTMSIVFLEIVIIAGCGIVRINGLSLFKYLLLCFKGPDVRLFKTKGMLDSYENEQK